jgi:hypothetical protein
LKNGRIQKKYEIALSNSVEDGRGFSEFGLSRVKVSAIVRSSKRERERPLFFFSFLMISCKRMAAAGADYLGSSSMIIAIKSLQFFSIDFGAT